MGKAAVRGFYDYPADATKTLWPGLWEHFVQPSRNPISDELFRDLQERFTFVMSLETIKRASASDRLRLGLPPPNG